MSLRIDTIVLGPLETNCYVLRSGPNCWVVDPGMMPAALLEFLRGEGATPGRVLLTHGHGDHFAGVNDIRSAWPAVRLSCPAGEAEMLSDTALNMSAPFGAAVTASPAEDLIHPGDTLTCGGSTWRVLDTSGHTAAGVSYWCPDEALVLTGDALFAGSIGRSDIPGGDSDRLLQNIRENLLSLPDETRVLPGHGQGSTIGRERRVNPFLQRL